MTAPIRIKTASDEVIDLAELRAIAQRGYRNTWPGLRIIILLDALEAALGVKKLGLSQRNRLVNVVLADAMQRDDENQVRGYNDALDDVRQAAGVVDDPPATSPVASEKAANAGHNESDGGRG